MPLTSVNPKATGTYNMVVVGAGAGGLVTAAACAGVGARVAIIESHLFGGDCLNVGCVPSKALIRAAKAVHEVRSQSFVPATVLECFTVMDLSCVCQVRNASQFGIAVDNFSVDFGAIMERL